MNVKSILAILIFHIAVGRSAMAQDQPMTRVRSDLDLIRAWVRDTASLRKDPIFDQGHVLDQVFDWEEIARRSFKDNWINLSKTWQSRMTEAVRRKLITDVSIFLSGSSLPAAEQLRWGDERITNEEARIVVDVLRDEWLRVQVRLSHRSGEWKVVEIRSGDVRVIADRLAGFDALVSEGYNPEYVESLILNSGTVMVDEFSLSAGMTFPRQWGWRKKDDDVVRQKSLFQMGTDRGNPYLSVHSYEEEVVLVRPFSLPLEEYPNLSWKWRIRGGERAGSGRLAGIGVIFFQNWLGMPVTIRYEWNGSAAPCAVIKQEGFLIDAYVRVLNSGHAVDGAWETETIDVLEDYRRLFNSEPPDQIVGVFLINPSDAVEADFDEIAFLKKASKLSCRP